MFNKYVYNTSLPFVDFKEVYDKYFLGKEKNEVEETFTEKLTYSDESLYEDGVKLTVSNNYLVPAIDSGIVVFIGDKDTRLFVYKNFDPYYTTLYIYRIPALNTISLFPSHSSNLDDRKTYEAVLKEDEISIYGFNETAKMTFKRLD